MQILIPTDRRLYDLGIWNGPLLQSDGLTLSGAHSIMRYLCDNYLPPSNTFYPRDDIKKRGIIDMMMDWHLTTLSFCNKQVEVKLLGEPAFLEKYKIFFLLPEQFPKEVHKSLKLLDTEFIDRGYFQSRSTGPTIADIMIFNEIISLNQINYPINKYPRILSILQSMIDSTPTVREVSRSVFANSINLGFQPYFPEQKL